MTASLFASVIVLPVLLRICYGPAATDKGQRDPVARPEAANLQLTEQ
jgi:hypothetical protein